MGKQVTSEKTTKLFIPHPHAENCSIVGVLEQLEPYEPTQGRRIALILHGSLGHKDYLFQKRLALRLPMDSFRFDFRGNFETPGTLRLGGIEDDIQDLHIVVRYLVREYGYVIDTIIGHSRGSVVGIVWLSRYPKEEAGSVRGVVNVSGRYRLHKMYDQTNKPEIKAQLERQGYYEVKAVVARQPVSMKVTIQDHHEFASLDTSIVWDRFPAAIDVLTIHGLKDAVVPPYDAFIYAKILGARSPGTHNLAIVEEADHNFTGRSDEVVDTVLEWLDMLEHKTLKTGIWHTGVRHDIDQLPPKSSL
ncbi:ectomycorrhiza-regulated esterase [Fomitopsis serialis]|uniref:ectomycorrhiza-regulated esterase n=1 Tax=Fomitopsis serialis TaxID=139415 RepID=UPI002008C339|nr:ectomycorrhiza-regulated esterase [Neoantrodia serialis]KAH9936277.1 ectomycorrhiza-regulated esterase [Neoantrodia serialis]